jgi:hypothetical protein
MANIEMFKANLTGGGARANQFEVVMNFPAISLPGEAGRKFTYLCKTASLPSSTIEPVEVPYRGRKLYVAGERTYADWTTTVYNDTDFAIHDAIERWIDGMDRTLVETANITNPLLYQSSAEVHQLDRNGTRLKGYTFFGMWPTEIAAIDLGYETDNEIETFDVTWKFNYFMSLTSGHITTI